MLGAFLHYRKGWARLLRFGLFAGSFEPLNSCGNTRRRQRQNRVTETSKVLHTKILNFHTRQVIIFAYQKSQHLTY